MVPVLLLAVIILPVSLKHYKLSNDVLARAYHDQINACSWVTRVDSIEGFILGSSGLKYGLSCNDLRTNDSVWVNFSQDARDPIALDILLEKYYTQKKPKVVLVSLDIQIFAKSYYTFLDNAMYLDLDACETWNFLDKDPSVLVTKFEQYSKYYILGNYETNCDHGQVAIPEDYGSGKLTLATGRFHTLQPSWLELKSLHWSDIQFEYLSRIKYFCHNNGIKLVFIISPKRKDFTNLSKTVVLEQHRQWWNKIDSVLDGEYIIGNYSSLDYLNQDSTFVDYYHLNPKGQKVFSAFVKNKLLAPDTISKSYSIY